MAKVSLILYKGKKLKKGKHPICIRISHKGRRQKFNTGKAVRKDQWDFDECCVKTGVSGYKAINKHIQKCFFRAENILHSFKYSGRPFSFDSFEREYAGIEAAEVFQFYEEHAAKLREVGKIGYALSFDIGKASLKKYCQRDKLYFNEVNYELLQGWEFFLKKRDCKDTTISSYMRSLRTLFNEAIKQKKCHPDCYPFKQFKISKFNTETRKRALTMEQINMIKDYEPEPNTKQESSKHLFLFSFYCRGMNLKDIVHLEWSNLEGTRLVYRRQKTGKLFNLKLLQPALDIIRYYHKITGKGRFVIPILDESHDTAYKRHTRFDSCKRRCNKHFKIMTASFGWEKHFTFYVARHSYATIMKKKGIPTAVISESMGHESERVTQIYLESFENEELDRMNEVLLTI
jgi:integrase